MAWRLNSDHPLAGPALLYEAVELGQPGRADEQAVAIEEIARRVVRFWGEVSSRGAAGLAARCR